MKREKMLAAACGVLAAACVGTLALAAHYERAYDETRNILEAAEQRAVRTITYDELLAMEESGESFILLASRVTCRYCALVEYLLPEAADGRLPVYIFDLEPFRGTDDYDGMKEHLGMTYIPTFFYFENGKIKYTMNNPMPDEYFDQDATAESRAQVRKETLDRINAFIDGAVGRAEPINEALITEAVDNS